MIVKGIVEDISNESIEGWVIVNDDKNQVVDVPKVELKVNGKTIAITFAVREMKAKYDVDDTCGFKFLIKDLYKYLNKNDEITISVYGYNIPIYKHGLSYKHKTNGIYNVDELFMKLNKDYIFDVNGELKLSLRENKELRKNTIDLYDELKKILEEEYSHKLYVCYSTLLGVIREKDFISNDGNFDCAYLSNYIEKDKVIEEFKIIAKFLINRGYAVEVFNSRIQVGKEDSEIYINIYCSWLNNESEYLLSFHFLGDRSVFKTNDFKIETINIFDSEIYIPESYEVVLNQTYGNRWHIPDFGFEWKPLKGKDKFMNDSDMNEIYWEQYYLNSKKQMPSNFCSFINDFIKHKYLILDIGCGSARDSFEFAKRGHEVIGLDRSEQAINFANSFIEEENYKNINFEIADISDRDLMSGLFRKARVQLKGKRKNIIYYSRFFLHSIDEENEKDLLETISDYIEPGDLFVSEFRIKEDECRQKEYPNHYRRFIDEKELLNRLEKICGLNRLLLFQKGNGFSIYKDEDPFLARIIVSK